jgi:hypothetical protein
VTTAIQPQGRPWVGILLVCGTTLCFAALDTVAKYLTRDYHPLQVVWGRYFFHALLLMPFLWKRGLRRSFATANPKLQIGRALLICVITFMFFTTLAYLPLVENAIGPSAFRQGDVLRALDGTTVEVGNTDAEGRLILADAIALARREGAGAIVSVATLTGAAMAALGRVHVIPNFVDTSAVIAEPLRPVISTAVISGASSRSADTAWTTLFFASKGGRLSRWPSFSIWQ